MRRQVNGLTDQAKSLNNASDYELEWGDGFNHLAVSGGRYEAYTQNKERGAMIRGVELGKTANAAPGTKQDYIMK